MEDWLQYFIGNIWWIIGGVVVILIVSVLVALFTRWYVRDQRRLDREIAEGQACLTAQRGYPEDPRNAFPWFLSMERFFRGLPDRVRALFTRPESEDPQAVALREARGEIRRLNEVIEEERARLQTADEAIQRYAKDRDSLEEKLKEMNGKYAEIGVTSMRKINGLNREIKTKNEEIEMLMRVRNQEVVNEEEPGPSNRLEPFVEAPVQDRPAGSLQDTDESDKGTENHALRNQPVNEEAPASSAGPSNRLDDEEAPVQERPEESESPQESVEFDSGSENQMPVGDAESSAGPSNRLETPESASPQDTDESDQGSEEGFVSKNRDDKQ
ncbi:hypothetical protein GCK72_012857 [Caenorhabditis remanei]|uniref:Uncharacterized protein n=1 Tax=Caenorhabditis remanei TaxID=31234 RepID=A0A6A5GP41_CAERE|nr:hypothetical protein GCK72_012857 [Caenorhabditis remanei]KAF1756404.1 hypothetical protein GCK72_012857 [Caenorhabditis remanei]